MSHVHGTRHRPVRVLYLLDMMEGEDGGTEGQVAALIRGLPERFQAHLWAFQHSAWLERQTLVRGARRLRIPPTKHPSFPFRMASLVGAVKSARIDLIHAYMSDAAILAPMLGRLAGVPVITSRRDFGYWQTPRKIDVLRRANRGAARIISNAAAVSDRTVQVEWATPGQVVTIPNGHPRARFEVEPYTRRALDLPEDARFIGLLANFRPLKRHPDLVEALARLGREERDVHLLFFGEGDAEPTLAAAREHGVADRVHVRRLGSAVLPALPLLSVGCLCSESEGLSNAIIEYMATGLPVIASRVGGNPELVLEGQTGHLYEAGDVEALSKLLLKVLRDPAHAQVLGEAGRARFLADYRAGVMVERTTAVYDAVLDDHTDPLPTHGLRCELVEGLAPLEALESDWIRLLGPRQPFLHPIWVKTAVEVTGARLLTALVRDERDTLVGLLPLVAEGRVLRFAGAEFGADHLDVIAASGRRLAIARAALDAFEASGCRTLHLQHLDEEAALRDVVRRTRRTFTEHRVSHAPYVEPDGLDYDAYLLPRFSRGARNRLRRKERQFEAREGARYEVLRTPEEIRGGLERVFRLHAARFADVGEASSFDVAVSRRFHERLVPQLAEAGMVEIRVLAVGDRDLGAEYGLVWRRTLFAFQSGIRPDEETDGPGTLLLVRMLRDGVFAGAYDRFDFLDGTEAYKDRWASGSRGLFDIETPVQRGTGRLRAARAGLVRLAKDEVKRRLGR